MTFARFDGDNVALHFVNQAMFVVDSPRVAVFMFETFGLAETFSRAVAFNVIQKRVYLVENFSVIVRSIHEIGKCVVQK